MLSPEPIDEKFRAFGWHAVCVNGHDIEQLHEAIEQARQIKGRPSVIVMKTIKGKVLLKWKVRSAGTGKRLRLSSANGL